MSTVKSTKVIDRFKPVTRKRDMEKEMYNEIESMAKQCVEMSKDKFKDESVCFIFKHNITYIVEGVKQDIEDIKKPYTNVKNVIKKIKGEEIIINDKNKTIIKLEKRINKTND